MIGALLDLVPCLVAGVAGGWAWQALDRRAARRAGEGRRW